MSLRDEIALAVRDAMAYRAPGGYTHYRALSHTEIADVVVDVLTRLLGDVPNPYDVPMNEYGGGVSDGYDRALRDVLALLNQGEQQ